jgi:hypothetical protein
MHEHDANIDQEAVVNGLNDAGSNLISIQDAQVNAEGAKLTDQERSEFERYKETISKGRDTFLEVGRALVAIRDGRLYREDYGTFEECCLKIWNISRAEGYRLIQDAEIYADLSPNGDIELAIPPTKAQLRALAQAEPKERAAVYAEAMKEAGDRPATGKHVKDAVARRGVAKVTTKKAEIVAKSEEKGSEVPKNQDIESNEDLDKTDEYLDLALTQLRKSKGAKIDKSRKAQSIKLAEQVLALLRKL